MLMSHGSRLAAMETKGRLKVASLQGSTNTCMQWAIVGPPGDERGRTGGDRDGVEGMMGQMDAVRSLAQYPERRTASQPLFLWIQWACPKRQFHLQPDCTHTSAHPLSEQRRFEYSKLSMLGFCSLIPHYSIAEWWGSDPQISPLCQVKCQIERGGLWVQLQNMSF